MDVADANPALAALRYQTRNAIAGLDLTLRRADRQMTDATAAEASAWAFEIAAAAAAFLAAQAATVVVVTRARLTLGGTG